jgi:hypothetical protein
MEKAAIEEIRAGNKKDKEDKQTKWVTKLGSATQRAAWKTIEKRARAQFTIAWTPAVR